MIIRGLEGRGGGEVGEGGVRQARREEARKLPRAAVGLISDRVG